MSDIKNCFVSRFEHGTLVEFDYSQLEIIGLAVLSRDHVLKSDIVSGIDLHCQNTANMYKVDYQLVKDAYDRGDADWTAKRKMVKSFSFQLQYGSGAAAMAKSNGVGKDVAEDFIKAYYGRYQGVKHWQDENIKQVEFNKYPTSQKSTKGYPICESVLRSSTGREYVFKEYDSPEWMQEKGIKTSFSPTMIKNYPVQGFSTGDVVPIALSKVFRYLLRNDLTDVIKIVNTVHDSILFDIDSLNINGINTQLLNLKQVMESISTEINNWWPDINFDMPLKVDASVGSNWGNITAVDLTNS